MLDPLIVAQLAPQGTLRAGINLANRLLVSGKTLSGAPEGIAPDLAREVATRLGVAIVYVPFAGARPMTDSAGTARQNEAGAAGVQHEGLLWH